MRGREDVGEGGRLGGPRRGPSSPAPASAWRARVVRRLWLALGFVTAIATLLALNWSGALNAVGVRPDTVVPSLRGALDAFRGPVRIGLQVGHLGEERMPRELAKLRTATGAEVGGLEEVDVNLAIVRALAARLRADGFEVDVLGATVPPGYRATLVLAVHADANPDPAREGYKSAIFLPVRNPRDPLLKLDVDRAVLTETNLGDDGRNVSIDMLKYYAFNARRFRHSVARSTAALIVEMGYLSNPRDRAELRHPAVLAKALADGVVAYLHDIQRIPPGPPGVVAAERP